MRPSAPDRHLATLLDQISTLEQKAGTLYQNERQQVIANIVADMEEFGISVEDLRNAREPNPEWRTRPPVRERRPASTAAKYRDPESGLTWSGQGRPPSWITAAEAQGRSRQEFLLPVTQLFGIDISTAPPKPAPSVDMSALSRALQAIEDKS